MKDFFFRLGVFFAVACLIEIGARIRRFLKGETK